MNKKEELESIYRALFGAGVVRSKKDMAERLGMNPHTVQSAFSVGEPYLNDKLLKRVRDTFADDLAQIEVQKSVDNVTIPVSLLEAMQETIASQQRTIERLVSGPLVGERVGPKKIGGDREHE